MTTIEIHEGQTTTIEIYNTVTDVQVIEVAVGSLVTTADLNAAITATAASASSANSAANSASLSAQSASLNAESAEESSESAFASSDIAQTAATNAAISAQQASASAMLASEVSLQQSFGRKFVPTISLDATSRTVPSYLPCVRAGVATFFDPSGVLRTSNANEGRIGFDPTTGECLGLLSEGSATNLVLQSNNITNATWLKSGITTQLSSVSIFGASSTKLIEGTSNTFLHTSQNPTTILGTTYTASVIAKASERSIIGIQHESSGTVQYGGANIDLNTLDVFTFNGVVSSQIKTFRLVDGWVLITYTFLRNSFTGGSGANKGLLLAIRASLSEVTSRTGDGTSGLFIQLAQLEVGNKSSYIPTTTTAPTRPADLFATTGFQFAKRYNQREGTFYVNTRAISDLTSTVAVFSDGTTDNETRLFANGTLTIRKAGVQIATIQTTGATLNEHSIFGFTYKGTRVVITRNGATVGVVTASEELATNYTQFQLGTGIYVRNLRYIPRALSDSELQFVTNPLYFVGLEGDKVPTINDLSSGAFMEVQDLQALRTRSEITIFGTGALRSIVINRPYPFLIEQVYVSPTGVTTATLPSLPVTGFYAANTDYTVLFNATSDRTLVLGVIPQTIN